MLSLTINGVEKKQLVEQGSLKINNFITSKLDTCKFRLLTQDFNDAPSNGNEVIIYDGVTKIFAGNITEVEEKAISPRILEYTITSTDWTRQFGRKLVPTIYQEQTVNAIIASLIATYAPSGFTTNNVDCSTTIRYIAFNYKPLDKCIQQLADLVGFDWYVDYDKDVHFFAKDKSPAPVEIEDDNGSVDFESLVIRRDSSQIKNVIYVRGGEYLGNTFSSDIVCDGEAFVFPVPYRFSEFDATLTGNSLSVGIDNINDAEDYHALYNFQEKQIKFKSTDTPSNGALLVVSGRPYIPVILKKTDWNSVSEMAATESSSGEYEFLIVDKTITSKEAAEQRALAELDAYKTTITEGEFNTETEGFKAGQWVHINSSFRGINEYYIINKVQITEWGQGELRYTISLVTTKTMGIIEYLQKLLLATTENVEIGKDEVVENINSALETITIKEILQINANVYPQGEDITMNETMTVQSLDYPVEFVLGTFTGYDGDSTVKKRVFLLDHSYLG